MNDIKFESNHRGATREHVTRQTLGVVGKHPKRTLTKEFYFA